MALAPPIPQMAPQWIKIYFSCRGFSEEPPLERRQSHPKQLKSGAETRGVDSPSAARRDFRPTVSIRVHSRLNIRISPRLLEILALDGFNGCLEDLQPGIPFVVCFDNGPGSNAG
jgi:hypothetical protein